MHPRLYLPHRFPSYQHRSANKPLPAPGSAVSAPSLTPPRSNTPSAPLRSTTPILTPVPAPRSTTPVAAPSPTSNTPVPYAVLSRTSSASPVPTNIPGVNSPSRPAPYRAGFQPKGVYRHRTEEFEAARLLQLIDLHFSPKEKDDAPPPPNRRSSSFFDDLAELKNKSPNELWRGVVESKAAQQERPPNRPSLNGRTTRTFRPALYAPGHHSTPSPTANTTADSVVESYAPFLPNPPLARSREVPDVIAYGVTLDGEKDNKYVKGVRICRTCRQYNIEAATIPAFSRIYQALLRLEGQIEDDLPQFQELVLNLKNGTHSNPSATSTTAAARKSLLDRFHEYDRLAKRLRALPCQPGSSQEKVQMAVSTRANVFLQKHMFPLQTLPKMKQLAKAATESELAEPDPVLDDPGHAIQPLLEQEAVLEQMLAEAQAARKIEDAQTLKANLTEIRNEIRRFMR
ncbi:hypothetical protein AG1IA_01171 [Rhizoctonia solani AG-1 IA]|uniref:Rabenosyn Rab binding domain-containing protein n=1 Tax=Thanatephorus cucumeris (strain AG1-IA) TaxID=983506 RepID=L8X3P2_THACA|nr:hypothetical protein AG1IA_01171 [Rhizoctonia solani AG-1 IA]